MEEIHPARTATPGASSAGGSTAAPEEVCPATPQENESDLAELAELADLLSRSVAPPPSREPGIYFCQVAGVTRRSGGDPLGTPGKKLVAVGDRVRLVPGPWNKLDPNALLVVQMNGQPIGAIGGRQAEKFAGRLHLVKATVLSWDKDEEGFDVLNLRVELATEPEPGEAAATPPEAPVADDVPLTRAQALWKSLLSLSTGQIMLGSLVITCTGVAVVRHSLWPLGIAFGALFLIKVMRNSS